MAPVQDATESDIFDKISKNDLNGVRVLLSQGACKVEIHDEHGMTPLQHAAYKGNRELVQLLIDQGANVNSGKHEYNYTALHFAALSGNVDICQILLRNGAKTSASNSVGRTPSQMAAFVGNHSCVAIINNFVPKSDVEYYTIPNGLETEPKLPLQVLEPLHVFIMQVNLHPVRVSINLLKSQVLCENLDKVHTVLDLMSKKEMKGTDANEIMAFKFHYLSCIVAEVFRLKKLQTAQQEGKEVGEGKGKPTDAVEVFIKKMLKSNKKGQQDQQELFLRDAVREFPHRESTLFRQMVTSLARGDCDHALPVIIAAVNGQRGFADGDSLTCCTCAEEKASKKCGKCKAVQYCDRECQRLHWFVHKKHCCRVSSSSATAAGAATAAASQQVENEKRDVIAAATEALKTELNIS